MAKCGMGLIDMENKKLGFRAKSALYLYRCMHVIATTCALGTIPFLIANFKRVREGFDDYLGNVQIPEKNGKPVLWIHGVSMGESMVAIGFAKELKKLYPESIILFTTTHPDVIADVEKRKIADAVAYFPLDNYRSMERIFRRWKPDAVFVAETDFWPEFSYHCSQKNIPLMLINGRISSKIATFYKRAKGIAEIVFGSFSSFAVQSQVDADRLMDIGVKPEKIHVLGNMKADFTHTSQVNLDSVSEWRRGRKTVVFGSLHPEELEILKPLFADLAKENIATIIAPRNIALAESWSKEVAESGITVAKKSEIKDSQVLILDTIGELASVYKLSDISFVGGSLDRDKTGGHNPLEVLQQGVPLLMGPYYRNFTDIVEQLKAKGGISIVKDADQSFAEIKRILADVEAKNNMVVVGNSVLESNKGVLANTIELVKSLPFNGKS